MVREMVHQLRRDWETPSFLLGRGKFRQSDPASRAEAMLFCAFWAGRAELIERLHDELVSRDALKSYHLSDIVLALLELEDVSRARAVLERREGGDARIVYCRAALAACEGELDRAEGILKSLSPDPLDRAYNSARLWLARGWSTCLLYTSDAADE